jgi:hypothetical protein
MSERQGVLPALDPRQLERIQAVHRGFLYQHLYAAACLLGVGASERFLFALKPMKTLRSSFLIGISKKIDIPVVSIAEISQKLRAANAGTEGAFVADTLSTDSGSVLGWFLEAGKAGDFHKRAWPLRAHRR